MSHQTNNKSFKQRRNFGESKHHPVTNNHERVILCLFCSLRHLHSNPTSPSSDYFLTAPSADPNFYWDVILVRIDSTLDSTIILFSIDVTAPSNV